MAEARKDLNQFLVECKKHASEPKFVVLGNQSADMDSIMSSISLAFYISQQEISSFLGHEVSFAIPIINIPREDMKLRKDSLLIFEKAGVSIENLLFAEDIIINDDTQIVLVDHNVVEFPFDTHDSKVSIIIDHHKDEGYFSNCKNNQRVIETAGSCLSIIAREILKGSPNFFNSHPNIALMFVATILLDTSNFDEGTKKTTPLDVEIYEKLSPLVDCPDFESLLAARIDVSGFSTGDLFRKDLKIRRFGGYTLAMASIPNDHESFVTPDFEDFVDSFMKSRESDPFCLMTTSAIDGKFKRELSLFSYNQVLLGQVSRQLEASNLQLSSLGSIPDSTFGKFWLQGNLAASRKKVMPILRKILENLGKL